MIKLQKKIQSQAESVISKEEALFILERKNKLNRYFKQINIEREKYFSKSKIHILDNIKMDIALKIVVTVLNEKC